MRDITYSATGTQTIGSTTVSTTSAQIAITIEGETTISYFATDNASNAETPKTITVKLDKHAPGITISAPANATYTLNQVVAASYRCADASGGSGLASCVGPVPSTTLSL